MAVKTVVDRRQASCWWLCIFYLWNHYYTWSCTLISTIITPTPHNIPPNLGPGLLNLVNVIRSCGMSFTGSWALEYGTFNQLLSWLPSFAFRCRRTWYVLNFGLSRLLVIVHFKFSISIYLPWYRSSIDFYGHTSFYVAGKGHMRTLSCSFFAFVFQTQDCYVVLQFAVIHQRGLEVNRYSTHWYLGVGRIEVSPSTSYPWCHDKL